MEIIVGVAVMEDGEEIAVSHVRRRIVGGGFFTEDAYWQTRTEVDRALDATKDELERQIRDERELAEKVIEEHELEERRRQLTLGIKVMGSEELGVALGAAVANGDTLAVEVIETYIATLASGSETPEAAAA